MNTGIIASSRVRATAEPIVFLQETIDYLTAAGVPYNNNVRYVGTPQERTNKQIWIAVNELITTHIDNGLWTGNTLYLLLGGTSDSTKIDAINPTENIIDWQGGWVFNQFGAKGNGIDTVGETGIPPSRYGNFDNGLTVVVGTDNSETASTPTIIGSHTTVKMRSRFSVSVNPLSLGKMYSHLNSGSFMFNEAESKGIYTGSHLGVKTSKFYKNGKYVGIDNSGGITSSYTFALGCNKKATVESNTYTTQEIRAVGIHRAFTDEEAIIYQNSLDKFYSDLGTKTWSEITPPPLPKLEVVFNANFGNNQGCVYYDGKLYIANDREPDNRVDVYNFPEGTFIESLTLTGAGHGNDIDIDPTDETLYVINGVNMYQYNIETGATIRTISRPWTTGNNIAIDSASGTFWTNADGSAPEGQSGLKEYNLSDGTATASPIIYYDNAGIEATTQGSSFKDEKIYITKGRESNNNGIIIVDIATGTSEAYVLNGIEPQGMTWMIHEGVFKMIIGLQNHDYNFLTIE